MKHTDSKNVARLAVLILLLGIAAPSLHAQNVSSGSVLGTVTDPSGAVVEGAAVRLTNLATGNTVSTATDHNGSYNFPIVPVGTYQLVVAKEGFKSYVQNSFAVNAAEFVRANASLTVGTSSEQVTVVETPPTVNTVAASEGNTVTGHQINELPLTNRVFTQLVLLEPGVVDTLDKTPGFGSNSSINFSVNGVASDKNNIMLDGVRNLDTFGGNAFIAPNLYAVSEFRVESNSYSATTGRSAGAQVNVISRAGTNSFHGNAFEFFRNNVMNARNYFAASVPENRYNDFGYDVGGPIKKNRIFFFWSQEWRRILQSAGPHLALVPTAAERSGDFSGSAQVITDPSTGQPYPGNKIPASQLDPNAQLLLQYYFPLPLPGFQRDVFNYVSEKPDFTRWREESIRVDAKVNEKLSLYARYTQDSVTLQNPYGLFQENALPDVGGSTQVYPIYHGVFHATYVPKPTFISEFTFGTYWDNDKYLQNGPLSNRSRAPGLNIPQLFPLDELNRIPSINFYAGNYSGIIEQWYFYNYSFSMPIQSDNTWSRGNHTIKFGLSFTPEGKSELANPSSNNTNGTFAFDGGVTGDALADFLIGRAYNYSETALDPFGNYRWFNLEPYVEDQIKVRPNLTLTLGLRYEYYQPEYEKHNFFASFNPAAWDPAQAPTVNPDGTIVPNSGNLLNGIIVAGKNSPYGDALFPSHKNAFAPRVGMVWDPTRRGTMAIRAGYGMFYDRWGSFSQFGGLNPPLNSSANVFNTFLSNPAGTSQSSSPIFPSFLNIVLPPWKYPSIQKWSASVQRELWANTAVSVAYVGTKGTHLMGALNPNQPRPNVDVANGTISADSVRPYRGFSAFQAYSTIFDSKYNALQLSLLHRLRHGVEFQASYTYSKATTNTSGSWGAPPQDEYNLRAESGPAGNNVPHVLSLNFVWDLPFLQHSKGLAAAALKGWQISGIANIQSGFPFTVTLPTDNAGVGGGLERPNLVGNPSGPKRVDQWFNTAAFAMPALGTFGNAGNNLVRGPGAHNWDMALARSIALREAMSLKLRAQAFNVFNHPSFNYLDTTFGDPSFGAVTSALAPRILQLGLELTF